VIIVGRADAIRLRCWLAASTRPSHSERLLFEDAMSTEIINSGSPLPDLLYILIAMTYAPLTLLPAAVRVASQEWNPDARLWAHCNGFASKEYNSKRKIND
jgi:hypothetical protein